MKFWLTLCAYTATIPAANWLIGHVGTVCVPSGPCLIPVGFGLMAPSGVLMVGLALVLRDAVQEQGGKVAALAAIAMGAAVSALIAPPAIVIASVAAFVASELLDFAVYTPLRKRSIALAVLASGIAGAAVDSAVFLIIAFGSIDFIAGQVLGKIYASLAVAAYLMGRSRAALVQP